MSREVDGDVVEAVARHLYLTTDQQYNHRVVRWDGTSENGLAAYDPDTQRRYRRQARGIVACLRAAERRADRRSTAHSVTDCWCGMPHSREDFL